MKLSARGIADGAARIEAALSQENLGPRERREAVVKARVWQAVWEGYWWSRGAGNI